MHLGGPLKSIIFALTILTATYSMAFENIQLGRNLNHAMRASGLVKLYPFSTDGCSMAPNGVLFQDWTECCIEHDIAYWVGGSRQDRMQADEKLMSCMKKKTEMEVAAIFFAGVRSGGRPFSIMPYRWGYGWNYLRTYEPLTDQEKSLITAQLGGAIEEKKSTLSKTPVSLPKFEVTFDYCDQLSVKLGFLKNLRGDVKNISMSVDSQLEKLTKKYLVLNEKSPRVVHIKLSNKLIECFNP